jgi:hypothetical protein
MDEAAPSTPVKRAIISQPEAKGSPNSMPLRMRLGRMLGRPGPISETEFQEAQLALVAAVKAGDRAQHFAQCRPKLPAAMAPLLLSNLATAWAQDNQAGAAAFENVRHCLVESRVAGDRVLSQNESSTVLR